MNLPCEINEICISIVVPCYNSAKYLQECVYSLVSQTLSNIEIIAVNDGSTDNTGELLDAYSRVYDNFIVYHQSNCGLSHARNKGIGVSRGEYILFVDSDDVISRNACEHLYQSAKVANADIVQGELTYNINELGCFLPNDYLCCDRALDLVGRLFMRRKYDIVSVLKLVKRKLLLERCIKFPEGLVFEDHYYSLLLYSHAQVSVYTPFQFYYYRKDNVESITSKFDRFKCENMIVILGLMVQYLRSHEIGRYKNILNGMLLISYYHLSSMYLKAESGAQLEILDSCKDIRKFIVLKTSYKRPRIVFQSFLFKYAPCVLKMLMRNRFILMLRIQGS